MDEITFEQAVEQLGSEEAFKCSIATLTTLLLQKGIISKEEWEGYYLESAKARLRKTSARHLNR